MRQSIKTSSCCKPILVFVYLLIVLVAVDFWWEKMSTRLDQAQVRVRSKDLRLFESVNKVNKFVSLNEKQSDFDLQHLATSEWSPHLQGDNETGFNCDVVPNIVHYILFDDPQITFVHYLSIKSVLVNHQPKQIFIHCNCQQLKGNYWNRLREEYANHSTQILVKYLEKPNSVFGQPFSSGWINWHASDVARIQVLMNFGGIYFDRDIFVVRSLKRFLKYEMTLPWDKGQFLGNQVLLANKNARFLKAYLNTYKDYRKYEWYWNAGERPTVILHQHPHLVHRVKVKFGVDGTVMCPYLYREEHSNWTDYYTIHLVMRQNTVGRWCLPNNGSVQFDEESVKQSKTTFGQMARLLLYGTRDLILK